jgi:hypothetical protein
VRLTDACIVALQKNGPHLEALLKALLLALTTSDDISVCAHRLTQPPFVDSWTHH